MKISILAMGTKMPAWVNQGFLEYKTRFTKDWLIELKEITAIKRAKHYSIDTVKNEEGKLLLNQIPKSTYVIALDQNGKQFNSPALATQLQQWQILYSHLCFLIGGPDGLSQDCLKATHFQWSLSLLTLPHPLVRLVLIESLYRAYTILTHHPYHR